MNVRRIGAAGIGVQWIIDAGFIDAIDVWGDDVQGEVCLDGLGSLLFLDARSSPRAQSWLDSYQRDGRTCAELAGPGTVVLMPANARARQCRIVTTGNLRVRARPSLDAEIIGFLRRGESLQPLSQSGGWIEIVYRGKVGWVGAGFVRDDCGGAVEVVSAAAREEYGRLCTTGNLRVRTGPSLDADTIGFLRRGESLQPLSQGGGWIEIDYQGEAGWIGDRYVSESGDCGRTADVVSAAAAAGDADESMCVTGHLRVRAVPSLDANTIGFLRKGESLTALSRRGDWIEINYRGGSGLDRRRICERKRQLRRIG